MRSSRVKNMVSNQKVEERRIYIQSPSWHINPYQSPLRHIIHIARIRRKNMTRIRRRKNMTRIRRRKNITRIRKSIGMVGTHQVDPKKSIFGKVGNHQSPKEPVERRRSMESDE